VVLAQPNPKFYSFEGLRRKEPEKKAAQTEVRAETTDKGGGDKLEVSHEIAAPQGKVLGIRNYNRHRRDKKC